MKPFKLISILIFFFIWCLVPGALVPYAFAANEDIIVSGDSLADTLSLADADLPATGSLGEIRYKSTNGKLYAWDGALWRSLSANKNVATMIVGVRRSPADPALDSLDASRADYICDGTNDQDEINQAITAITNQATNPSEQGVIYLLDGTYNITGSINIADNNISLIGSGRGTVLRVAGGSDTEVINISSASGVSGILLSQFTIDGNSQTGSYDGILLAGVTNSRISNILIDNVAEDGLDIDGCSNNTITGNTILNCDDEGMDIEANTAPDPDVLNSNNVISNNIVRSCGGEGIDAGSFIGGVISNNIVIENSGGADGYYGGIRIAANSSGNVVSGNTVLNNVKLGIDCAGYRNVISGNSVNGNGSAGGDGTDDGISVGGSYNTVFNNSVFGNDDDGINLSGSSNLILGNSIYNNTNDGILVGASNNVISANYISNSSSPRTGIKIASGWNNYLTANTITTSIKIADSGTNTRYTGKEKITLERTSISGTPATLTPAGSTNPPGPTSYIALNPGSSYALNSATAIADGKADGDILILENISAANTVTIPNAANTKLSGAIALGPSDTLTLIWKSDTVAANSNWVQLSFSAN